MTVDLTGGKVPEGSTTTAQVKTLQSMTEEDVKNKLYGQQRAVWAQARENFMEQVIGGVFDGFLDLLKGDDPPDWLPFAVQSAAKQVADGMTALNGRTELLEGVRGFCMAYQTLNINTAWSLAENTREMPFNGPYGPNKGAHISGNGITLDEAGAWRIDAMIHADETNFLGSDGARMSIVTYKPDGTEHSRKRFDSWPGPGSTSIYGGHPLVVDEPGYYIRIESWTGRWRWWTGGTMHTFLSAVKYDNRIVNPGQETVPNETQG